MHSILFITQHTTFCPVNCKLTLWTDEVSISYVFVSVDMTHSQFAAWQDDVFKLNITKQAIIARICTVDSL